MVENGCIIEKLEKQEEDDKCLSSKGEEGRVRGVNLFMNFPFWVFSGIFSFSGL